MYTNFCPITFLMMFCKYKEGARKTSISETPSTAHTRAGDTAPSASYASCSVGLQMLITLGLFQYLSLLSRESTPGSSWFPTKPPSLGDKDLLVACLTSASSEAAWEYFLSSKSNSAVLLPLAFHNKGKPFHSCLLKLAPTTPRMKYSQKCL